MIVYTHHRHLEGKTSCNVYKDTCIDRTGQPTVQ